MANCSSFHLKTQQNPARQCYTKANLYSCNTCAWRKSKSREDDYVCFGRKELYSKRGDKSICTKRLPGINSQPLQHGAHHPQRKHARPGTAFAVLQQNHGMYATS